MQCERYRQCHCNQCGSRSRLIHVHSIKARNRHKWSEGSGRYKFLDLFRGIIVLFMLEGHVVRELLSPENKLTWFFSFHEIFHGVTAPGFLFGAGFTFAIAAQRRWEQSITFSRGFFRRSWRAVMLIFMGYALHFPFLSLQKTITEANSIQWNSFLLFDVLQCIGVGLLFLRFLLVICKHERIFLVIGILLTLTVVYTTPYFWTTHIQQILPSVLSTAFNGFTGSPFPLFPFIGFLLSGTCVSWLFLRAAQEGREELFVAWTIVAGAFFIGVGFLFDALPFQTYHDYMFWNTSPNYFWIRLGILLVMLGGFWHLEDYFSSRRGVVTWMPRWLTILGIESLFVYIAHLLILCGWVTNIELNFRWWWGNKLTIAESFLVFACLTLVMILASFTWHYIKKQHPKLMIGLYWWMGFCVAWSFFFNPY
jgi:uncharacterized membrane protein